MTVAERMRKDGWSPLHNLGWTHRICGVWVFVNSAGWIARTPWLPDDEAPVSEVGYRRGLIDLAQRAKAAARRLARKGKR